MPARVLIVAAALWASAARAEPAEWLFGGHWVELDKPCETRLPDGRDRPAGMAFEEGKATFHPPAGLTEPAAAPVTMDAQYMVSGDVATVRTRAPNGATTEITLRRAGQDQVRDEAGYVYRRCIGMVS